MMSLITLLESPQNADGVFYARLANIYRLKAPLKRGVLLDIFAILIQGCCANGVQLSPRQHGFKDIPGIHRPLGFTCTNNCVQLINKEQNLPFSTRQFVKHRFETLLKLTTILRACNQRPHIQLKNALVFQALRNIATHNALRQSLNNGSFANTRLANQHRVVFGSTRKNLHHPAHFIIASNNRVEFALLCQNRQVASIALESRIRSFGRW
ncbi:MAG: hypothetical protein BWY63_03641 [Chloroflexi bacterium ADurb.Bin360]|nr:MAG: hypothetical protein BWY63_03641 [Chloroflexi bacterium ADurb.Bin360]